MATLAKVDIIWDRSIQTNQLKMKVQFFTLKRSKGKRKCKNFFSLENICIKWKVIWFTLNEINRFIAEIKVYTSFPLLLVFYVYVCIFVSPFFMAKLPSDCQSRLYANNKNNLVLQTKVQKVFCSNRIPCQKREKNVTL